MPNLLAPFNLQPAQGLVDFTDSDFAAASLPSGWKLLWANQHEPPEFGGTMLRTLSEIGELLLVHVEENSMSCSAELWADGKQVWRVAHDAKAGSGHLSAEGRLPDSFVSLRQQQMQRQLEADNVGESVDHIFEVPMELANQLCGFRYDETDAVHFELLNADLVVSTPKEQVVPEKAEQPWWKFW